DWGANNDRAQGILAGLDLQMPGDEGIGDRDIAEAVKSGKISVADLDKVAGRMIEFILRCAEDRETRDKICDYDAHYELAAEIATKGAVLLKNDGTLPLQKGKKIAVVGTLAKEMRYQGSGSSQINPYKLKSFVDYLDEIKADYVYSPGYDINGEKTDKKLLSAALDAVKDCDVVLAFVGLTDVFESEGFDREHLNIPASHNDLVDALVGAGKKVVAVLSGGSPMILPWADKVSSILNMYLAGSAGGKACYKLLFGEVNPSGKLAETFPKSLKDNPAYLYYRMGPQTVEYREGIYVGYRYFDTAKKDVAYPFGFGLSYTTFGYSDLKLSKKEIKDDEEVTVTFRVKNTGERAGEEVAQVYVRDVESTIFREDKALKGFVKVALEAGEEKEVSVTLNKRSFAFYNVNVSDWTVESGEFEILVGASSRDIRLTDKVTVTAPEVAVPDYRQNAKAYYEIASCADLPEKDFEAILGRPLVDNHELKKGEIDYNATIGDLGTSWIGRLLRWAAYTFAAVVLPKGSSAALKKMVKMGAMDMPLRNIYAMTAGLVSRKVVDGLIMRSNGGPFCGVGTMIGGLLQKKPPKKSEIYKTVTKE
ncbi:MAG: glycoside hydrolase family 3 C-terminal domain-containing protein, partial [Clostridia bacterium]|nr:glycoside hydrolase family 3 C-terminal domain-containing protein [Clostridia bacterium]